MKKIKTPDLFQSGVKENMKFKTLNNKIFEANSYTEVANIMMSLNFSPTDNMDEWLKMSAARVKLWNGAIISTDNPEQHILDMLAAGVLERLE